MIWTTDQIEEQTEVDLAPETLHRIEEDCAKFEKAAWKILPNGSDANCDARLGHDFWLTRNGHGSGFWDGDWPEPEASKLTKLSESFGEIWAYLGDDGKVYLCQ